MEYTCFAIAPVNFNFFFSKSSKKDEASAILTLEASPRYCVLRKTR